MEEERDLEYIAKTLVKDKQVIRKNQKDKENNITMAFKMKSPLKKIEELEEVVDQLKGAVKAHTNQHKTIQKHINMMKKSK